MNKIIKTEKSFSVYDLENDKFVEVTPEQQHTAAYFHNQVLLGAFVSAIAIKKIFDERLYLAMGCQSKEEYIETTLPFGRNQAYKLFAIANKFDSVSKSFSNNNLLGDGSSENSETVPNSVLSSFSIEKLYELSKMDNEQLDKLSIKGKVKIDGEEFTLEDFKEMSAKEVAQQIKKATGKYQEKLKKIETENIQLTEQNKLLESEKEHLISENKNAKDLEMLYGPEARNLKVKKERLELARQSLNNFDEYILKAAITEEDPHHVQKDLVDLIAKVDEVHQRIIDVYGIITTRF